MRPLTQADIRSSFVNATPAQIDQLVLPGLHEMLWDEREFLGWRDPRSPRRGYIVHWMGGRPTGLVLKAAGNGIRSTVMAMCSFCHARQPATRVRLFSAARAGDSGLRGDTVGSYICDDLACPLLIRRDPAHLGDWGTLAERGAAMLERVQGFTRNVARPS